MINSDDYIELNHSAGCTSIYIYGTRHEDKGFNVYKNGYHDIQDEYFDENGNKLDILAFLTATVNL